MKILFISLVLLAACSRINQSSRDYYQEQHKVRHGLVPLTVAKPRPVSSKLKDESIARGKVLYERDCLRCHGASGVGDGPDAGKQKHKPMNLRETVMEVRDFEFYLSISQWQGEMPGWKEPYSAADREDIAAYLKTFR